MAEYAGGICWISPRKRGIAASIWAEVGRTSEVAVTRPSASSLSRASPQQAVNRYVFSASMAKATVLVASPSATASTPVAMGSSVPAWPAFWALNTRLTVETAWVEVTPCGLSRITQPWTASPFFLRLIAVVLQKVLLYPGRFEQVFDLLGLGEGGVFDEAQLRREAQRDGLAHQPADETLVPIERGDDALGVLAAQGLHEHGGVPHVGRRLDLRHGDRDAVEIGIADVAAPHDVRQRMAQHLAHPQLTLRRSAIAFR